jgi:hypothetical protein
MPKADVPRTACQATCPTACRVGFFEDVVGTPLEIANARIQDMVARETREAQSPEALRDVSVVFSKITNSNLHHVRHASSGTRLITRLSG